MHDAAMPGGLTGAQQAYGRRQHEDHQDKDDQCQRDGALDERHEVAVRDARLPGRTANWDGQRLVRISTTDGQLTSVLADLPSTPGKA